VEYKKDPDVTAKQREQISRFAYMVGKTYKDNHGRDIFMSERFLVAVLRKVVASVRKRKDFPRMAAKRIVDEIVTEQDILNNINCVSNLINTNPSFREKSIAQEVRCSILDLEDFSHFLPSERNFIEKRMSKYTEGIEGELEPNDEFTVLQIVLLELEIWKLNKLKAADPEDKKEISKKLKPQIELHQKLCEGLNLLRKQRKKEVAPEEEDSLYGLLSNIGNMTEEDFEEELSKEEEEEKRYLKRKH